MIAQLRSAMVIMTSSVILASLAAIISDVPTSPDNLVLLQLHAQYASVPKDGPEKECLPAGELFFAHVMKDGGSSIDKFLNCLCEKAPCSIRHMENGNLSGHQNCEPSVCTSHGPVIERSLDKECGPAFKDSKVFTVMRDPVSRVFSFYVYMRYKKHDEYYQRPLKEILHNYKDCYNSDSWFICSEMNSSMVGKYFVNRMVLELNGVTDRMLASVGSSHHFATPDNLQVAKEMLSGFEAVFFIEDFNRFPHLYNRSGLPLSTMAEQCELPHTNDNWCKNCEMTDEERDLITELNWADIELYNYSKNQSNRIR